MDEHFRVRIEADSIVVFLDGEVVMDMIQECKMEMESLIARDECREMVVDLSGVTFMDSSGIGFLIGLRRRAEAAGRRFSLRNPSPPIRKLLDMLKLSDFFSLPPVLEDASPVE